MGQLCSNNQAADNNKPDDTDTNNKIIDMDPNEAELETKPRYTTQDEANNEIKANERKEIEPEKSDIGYLDFPRLHFDGIFRANPSTNNNQHFHPKEEMSFGHAMLAKFKPITAKYKFNGGNWTPYGDGTWSFKDCRITAAFDEDGKMDDKTYSNLEVNPSSDRISGRIVDLDPQQQSISRIFGFRINLCEKNNNNKFLFKSNFQPSSFHNMWKKVGYMVPYANQSPAQGMGSEWISILTDCEFGSFDSHQYPVLDALRRYAANNENKLMMKFIVDGYNADWTDTTGKYTTGRVYGVIGVYSINHPTRSLKYGRYAAASYPSPPPSTLVGGFAGQYVTIKYNKDTNYLYVDISNFLPQSRGKDGHERPVNLNIGDIHVNLKINHKTEEPLAIIKSNEYTNAKIGDIFPVTPDPPQYIKCGGIYSFKGLDIDIVQKYGKHHPIIVRADAKCVGDINKECLKWTLKAILNNLQNPSSSSQQDDADEEKNEEEKNETQINAIKEEIATIDLLYEISQTEPKDEEYLIANHDGYIVYLQQQIKEFEKHKKEKSVDKYQTVLTAVRKDKDYSDIKDGIYATFISDRISSLNAFTDSSQEAPNGYFAMSENLQMRLGTVGDGALFGRSIEFKTYVSQYGVPLKSDKSINIRTFPMSHSPKGYDKTIGITKIGIENGFYRVTITAPHTLFDENGNLPRWNKHYYLTSFVYGLGLYFGDNNKNAPANFVKAKVYHKSHEDSRKVPVSDDQVSGFFVGSVLVFNELKTDQLPAVISWQPHIDSDFDKTTWKQVIDEQPNVPYIHPIFRQYANLYPVMKDIVNLDDYQDVTTKIPALKRAFNAPFDSAHYMPVSRDLSGQQLMIINAWLNNPVFCDNFIDPMDKTKGGFVGVIRDKDTLKEYLQIALEIELSTLPIYLSALYSMDPNNSDNAEIIELIRSITHEEMQHMALVCNLLLSIGGTPRIAYRDVVERTSFPRIGLINSKSVKVLPDAPLELSPMNVTTLMETFMNIEAPAKFEINKDNMQQRNTEFIFNNFVKVDQEKTNAKPDFFPIYNSVAFKKIIANSKQNSGKADKFDEQFTTLKITYYNTKQDHNGNVANDDSKYDDPVRPVSAATDSIGGFYELIRKGFVYLNSKMSHDQEELFNINGLEGAIKNQIGPTEMKDVNYIYDIQTALNGIEAIVSEGEGTSLTDIWKTSSKDLSHFHKYLEIYMRKFILTISRRKRDQENKNEFPYVYVFANDVKIPFDENGVVSDESAWEWLKYENKSKMNDNPNSKDVRVIRFNEVYGKLLLLLQDIFGNGKKEEFGAAVGLMRQLQICFNECLRAPTKDGITENDNTEQTLQKRIAPNWIPPHYIITQ